MEFFAVIGAINLMLAACIALVLPIALAIWVAPIWLILYGIYLLVIILFACIVTGSDAEKRGKPERMGDE